MLLDEDLEDVEGMWVVIGFWVLLLLVEFELEESAEGLLVGDSEGAFAHAAKEGSIADIGGGLAFGEHGNGFEDIGAEGAEDIESGCVFDDYGDFADVLDEVYGAGDCFLVGIFADDDFDEAALLDRGEEVHAYKGLGSGEGFGDTIDGEGCGVGG